MHPDITPIFNSTPNLEKPPLCQSCQFSYSKWHVPKVIQPTNNQQEKWDLWLRLHIKLVILSLLTNLLLTMQALLSKYGTQCHRINFMVAQFSMMLLQIIFWLRIKSQFELEKCWWPRNAWTIFIGISCYWNTPPSQWQWDFPCWIFFWGFQEQVPDSVILWSPPHQKALSELSIRAVM